MHVAHVLKSLDIGGFGGGAERFALSLSNALGGLVEAQTMIVCLRTCSATERKWEEVLQEARIPVIYLQNGASLKPFAGAWSMKTYARQHTWDVVHTHYQVGALYACFLRRVGLLRTVHTPLEWGNGLAASVARAIFSRLVFPVIFGAQVGVSMSITEALNRSPGARLSKHNATYIPNALPDEWFLPEQLDKARQRDHRANGPFVVGSLGRLARGKGYSDLLAAFPRVVASFPGTRLWLIGDGELRSALEEQASQLGVTEQVHFWGQSSNVAELLTQMDLMVLPSLVEGMPTVILESMACGTPVVGTRIPGVVEIIREGETGWLVQPQDPNGLADTICRALADAPMRAHYSVLALAHLENFSIRRVAERYVEIYHGLL